VVSLTAAADPPAWAYPVNPPDFKPRVDDGTPRRVPDSGSGYTVTQLRDLFAAHVWHPEEHPPLRPIVAQGRKPAVFACGVCHRADGPGGPENANIAGLPADYIIQQMADYKSGARSTSLPDRAPQKNMIALSKAITEDEVREAAAYFAARTPRHNVRVVESADVPTTVVGGWFLADAKTGRGSRSARASSRCPRTPSSSRTATRTRASSPMCRRAASRRARRSPPVCPARPGWWQKDDSGVVFLRTRRAPADRWRGSRRRSRSAARSAGGHAST
jgi:cytochrome c553